MGLGFLYHQKFLSRLALKIVVMALGKRQEARVKIEEGLGDFTFRYILLFEKPLRVYGFFPFTYLQEIKSKLHI